MGPRSPFAVCFSLCRFPTDGRVKSAKISNLRKHLQGSRPVALQSACARRHRADLSRACWVTLITQPGSPVAARSPPCSSDWLLRCVFFFFYASQLRISSFCPSFSSHPFVFTLSLIHHNGPSFSFTVPSLPSFLSVNWLYYKLVGSLGVMADHGILMYKLPRNTRVPSYERCLPIMDGCLYGGWICIGFHIIAKWDFLWLVTS